MPFLRAKLDHIALRPQVVVSTGSASVAFVPTSLSVAAGVLSVVRPYLAGLAVRTTGSGTVVVDIGVIYLDKNGKLLDDTAVRGKFLVGAGPLQLT